jgi:hypothetical protein
VIGSWFVAPAAALWTYAGLTVGGEAYPNFAAALAWWADLGAYSGKTAAAGMAFVAGALAARRPVVAWERWAVALPALYLGAVVATWPPVALGLAAALRRAVAWVSSIS